MPRGRSLVILFLLFAGAPLHAQAPATEDATALTATIDALAKGQKWAEANEAARRLIALGEARGNLDLQAEGWHRLGLGQQALKEPEAARSSFERALQLRLTLGDRIGAGNTHNSLGVLAWQAGNAALVRLHFSAAADEFAAAGDVARQAHSIRNLTFAHDMPTSERIATLERAWELVARTDDKHVQGLVLHMLGDMINLSGDYARAIEKLEAAIPLLERSGSSRDFAGALTSLGRTFRLHGLPERALDVYRRVLVIQEAADDIRGQAQTWDAIGTALFSAGRGREAVPAHERALALAQRGPEIAQQVGFATSLGIALLELGDVRRAIAVLEPLAAAEVPIRNRPELFSTLAGMYDAVGRPKDALELLDDSIALGDELEYVEAVLQALGLRAQVRRKLSDPAGALADTQRALEIVERLRVQAVPRDAMKRSFVDQHAKLFTLAIELHQAAGHAAASLEIAERARARAFQDLMASRALANRPAPAAREPDLPSGAAVPPPDIAAIRSAVHALDTTLISYWVGPEATTIWIVPPDGTITVHRVAVKAARFDALSRQISSVVAGGARGAGDAAGAGVDRALNALSLTTRSGTRLTLGADPRRPLRELYQLLVEPIEAQLPAGENGLLTIVPHGPLFSVPFAALVDARGRYLVENHRLHVVPSAALLTAPHVSSRATRYDALVVADPAPMPQTEPALGPLPGARAEAQAIARLFPPEHVTLLTGRDATKPRVRASASQPAVLHLATHGLVFDDRPFDSFLALAGTSAEGRLGTDEIYRLSLNADLVVLSACRTASGTITGDGVIGLARAFFYAGAPSVVASLWDLPDSSARELMPVFYRRWLRDGDKSAALRDAQLAYIKALRRGTVTAATPLGAVKVPEHPAPWAGMVLIGRP